MTVGSRPRKSKNCEGVASGEASLSPLFVNCGGLADGRMPGAEMPVVVRSVKKSLIRDQFYYRSLAFGNENISCGLEN